MIRAVAFVLLCSCAGGLNGAGQRQIYGTMTTSAPVSDHASTQARSFNWGAALRAFGESGHETECKSVREYDGSYKTICKDAR